MIILNDFILLNLSQREFLGGSVVMTSPSNGGGAGLILGHASWPKSQKMWILNNITQTEKEL